MPNDRLTREQSLVSALMQLGAMGVGLWLGVKYKHPLAYAVLGSIAGGIGAAVYIYKTTPPSLPAEAAPSSPARTVT